MLNVFDSCFEENQTKLNLSFEFSISIGLFCLSSVPCISTTLDSLKGHRAARAEPAEVSRDALDKL